MQTQVMQERAVGLPWLEYCGTGHGRPERTVLESFPFTIGRDESADLTIDSGRVSREHATIVREGDAYRVRDLGSTNGTFLNGRQIDDAPLCDGDLLMIADVELSFFSGHRQGARDAVTQVIDRQGTVTGDGAAPGEIIRDVRQLQEALTHGCVENLFQPIVHLEGGAVFGYEAIVNGGSRGISGTQRWLLATDCRLTGRLRRLRRMVAVEEAASLPGKVCLLLKVESSELGAGWLAASLGRLRDALADDHRLVVAVPDGAASDTPYFREFCVHLHELDIRIAYDGFAGGETQLTQHPAIRPDFVKLAEPLVREIQHDGQRQEQVRAIAGTAREIGCEVIAAGLRSEEEAATCRGLGCRFGQGDFFGSGQPIQSLISRGPVCQSTSML